LKYAELIGACAMLVASLALAEPPTLFDDDLNRPDPGPAPKPPPELLASAPKPPVNFYPNHVDGTLDSRHRCHVKVYADGVEFNELLDSGADELVFFRNHMALLGVTKLTFDGEATTANGVVKSSQHVIHELRIGTFVMHEVSAHIDNSELETPLLGTSILKMFHVEMGHGVCTLRW
jgi:clan AA aspartic protease (TIGR02281 family)